MARADETTSNLRMGLSRLAPSGFVPDAQPPAVALRYLKLLDRALDRFLAVPPLDGERPALRSLAAQAEDAPAGLEQIARLFHGGKIGEISRESESRPKSGAGQTTCVVAATIHQVEGLYTSSPLILLSQKVAVRGWQNQLPDEIQVRWEAEMDLRPENASGSRFESYVDGLVIGHADRAGPLRDYCVGLMMQVERKSVEPMAAVTAPDRTAAQHQSLLHFVGEGRWSDERVLAKVRAMVLPEVQRRGRIEAWIIDDTSFPKQGRHSVGVARQYCGQLGKQDNCQVAVSLSLANRHASLPVAYRLYLPQEWTNDRERLRQGGCS
jgi:DDE superfamily endonuclease